MAKRSLLLVDGDASSLRVLEVSLRKAGFNVTTALTPDDALHRVQSSKPDLVISATKISEDLDGFDFCAELKGNAEWRAIPFIFVAEKDSLDEKIRGLELGVEDYLVKPLYIKEIITRVRILLQKRERAELEEKRDNRTRFAGSLGDMGVVDLLQTIELSRKSGLIHITAPSQRQATVYFRDGVVVDAEAARLQGEDAVYRLLTWTEGSFEVLFRNVRRRDVIQMSTQGLLMEGMRRLDEWGRLLEQLPSTAARFRLDFEELAARLPDLPDELNSVLRLFDGRRTLLDIIDESSFSDLEALEIISRLYFEGVICEVVEDEEPQLAARFDRMELAPRSPSRSRHATNKDTIPGAVPPPVPVTEVAEAAESAEANVADAAEVAEAEVAEVAESAEANVADAAEVAEAEVAEVAESAEAEVAEVAESAEAEVGEAADAAEAEVGEAADAAEAEVAAETEPDEDDDEHSAEAASAAFGQSLLEAAGGGQSLIDAAIGNAGPVVDEESGKVLAAVASFVADATAVEVATWNDKDEHADGMVEEGAQVLNDVGQEVYDKADAEWFQPKRPESEADTGLDAEAEAREAVAGGEAMGVPSPIDDDASVGRVNLRPVKDEGLAPVVELRPRRRGRPANETAKVHALGGVVSSQGEDKAVASGEVDKEPGVSDERVVAPSAVELQVDEEDIVELPEDEIETLDDDDIETLDDDDVIEEEKTSKSPVQLALEARRKSREVLIPKAPPPLRPPKEEDDDELDDDDIAQLRREKEGSEGGIMWTAIIAGTVLVGLLAVAFVMRPGNKEKRVAATDAAAAVEPDQGNHIDPVTKPAGDAGAIQQPAGGDIKPTGGDTKPTGGDTKPTGGDTKPTGGDTKSTGGDTKPTGGDTKPTGGDTKPPDNSKQLAREAKALLGEARKLRSQGKHQDALAKVNESIAKRRSASALVLKADLMLKLRDQAGALAAAEAAVKTSPGSASAWRIKGVIHLEMGQNGPAKAAFQKYLNLAPKAKDREDIQLLIESL